MPGYLNDIDDAPAGLVDGCLATGDLGVVDADGILTIAGRTKEIINRGGEKISPYDVGKMLLQHPAVREAAAFAVPHPRLGESVAAAVVLNDNTEETSSSALVEFLRDRLAPFQMPRHVHILPALPKGTTGKISRSQLSADFSRQVRKNVHPDEPLQIQIAAIWVRVLNHSDFGIDDDFFEAGGDSLQATEMLLELEAITRQAIASSDIKAELTVRHLATTLARAAAARHEVVTKVKDGSGRPLFICHGDFDGWGNYALRLAELIKDEGPIYLLHPNFDKAAGSTPSRRWPGATCPIFWRPNPKGSSGSPATVTAASPFGRSHTSSRPWAARSSRSCWWTPFPSTLARRCVASPGPSAPWEGSRQRPSAIASRHGACRLSGRARGGLCRRIVLSSGAWPSECTRARRRPALRCARLITARCPTICRRASAAVWSAC
ncbi:MAG: non-ribosomal peptide synthetase [Reyranella sp.]|nr:non-ribosomal peptide synthetase [Reyranella sp.]